MATNILELAGNYQRQGSTLTKDDGQLKICSRKNPTPNKASEFLVFRSPENPKGIYVSSLYERGQGIYSLDYQNRRYRLSLSAEDAQITLLPK